MSFLSIKRRTRRARTIRQVLIVEDEPLIAFDNEHALTQAGYHVVGTVDRHAAAVAAMDRGGIDLVIVDIRLPGGPDGLEVARHAVAAGIAVLFSSGKCTTETRTLGAGCLVKPYDPRVLVRAVCAVEASLDGRKPRSAPPQLTLFPRGG